MSLSKGWRCFFNLFLNLELLVVCGVEVARPFLSRMKYSSATVNLGRVNMCKRTHIKYFYNVKISHTVKINVTR